MPFKKVEVTLKFPKRLHLEKLLLAYVIVLSMPYNFCNHNIFIFLLFIIIFIFSLKIAMIFKVIALYIDTYTYKSLSIFKTMDKRFL